MNHQEDARFRHRLSLSALLLASALLAGALLVLTPRILLVAFIGVVLGIFVTGLIRYMCRTTSLPYVASFTLVWLILLGGPALLFTFVIPSLRDQFRSLASVWSDLERTVSSMVAMLPEGLWSIGVGGQDTAVIGAEELFTFTQAALGSLSAALTALLLVIFVGLYLSFDPRLYTRFVRHSMPQQWRPRATQELERLGYVLRWWCVGRVASMVVVFFLTYLGLSLLGVELAFLLSLLAGALSLIPNIGSIATMIIAVLVTLPEGVWFAAAVGGVFVLVQTVESYAITPYIEQQVVHTPPAFLLILQVVMGLLFGIAGLLASGPIAAVVTDYVNRT